LDSGTEVLLFAALVGEAGIPPGHLNIAMTHQQLQTLQAHTGIEQFACEGMKIMPSSDYKHK
jgi:hypothetical protein